VMILVFAHYLWSTRHAGGSAGPGRTDRPEGMLAHGLAGGTRVTRSLALLVVSCWGILAFMGHLWVEFGDPSVWYSNHSVYNVNHQPAFADRIMSLLALEPIWSVYLPETYSAWGQYPSWTAPLWSLRFVNPIYFVVTCGLIGYGGWSRILEPRDVLVGALLLAVPYLTKGHDNAMLGFARYCSVVYPAYIVAADILMRLPRPLAAAGLGLSAVLMSFYSALFAAWYDFI